jgi:hypothetical protein
MSKIDGRIGTVVTPTADDASKLKEKAKKHRPAGYIEPQALDHKAKTDVVTGNLSARLTEEQTNDEAASHLNLDQEKLGEFYKSTDLPKQKPLATSSQKLRAVDVTPPETNDKVLAASHKLIGRTIKNTTSAAAKTTDSANAVTTQVNSQIRSILAQAATLAGKKAQTDIAQSKNWRSIVSQSQGAAQSVQSAITTVSQQTQAAAADAPELMVPYPDSANDLENFKKLVNDGIKQLSNTANNASTTALRLINEATNGAGAKNASFTSNDPKLVLAAILAALNQAGTQAVTNMKDSLLTVLTSLQKEMTKWTTTPVTQEQQFAQVKDKLNPLVRAAAQAAAISQLPRPAANAVGVAVDGNLVGTITAGQVLPLPPGVYNLAGTDTTFPVPADPNNPTALVNVTLSDPLGTLSIGSATVAVTGGKTLLLEKAPIDLQVDGVSAGKFKSQQEALIPPGVYNLNGQSITITAAPNTSPPSGKLLINGDMNTITVLGSGGSSQTLAVKPGDTLNLLRQPISAEIDGTLTNIAGGTAQSLSDGSFNITLANGNYTLGNTSINLSDGKGITVSKDWSTVTIGSTTVNVKPGDVLKINSAPSQLFNTSGAAPVALGSLQMQVPPQTAISITNAGTYYVMLDGKPVTDGAGDKARYLVSAGDSIALQANDKLLFGGNIIPIQPGQQIGISQVGVTVKIDQQVLDLTGSRSSATIQPGNYVLNGNTITFQSGDRLALSDNWQNLVVVRNGAKIHIGPLDATNKPTPFAITPGETLEAREQSSTFTAVAQSGTPVAPEPGTPTTIDAGKYDVYINGTRVKTGVAVEAATGNVSLDAKYENLSVGTASVRINPGDNIALVKNPVVMQIGTAKYALGVDAQGNSLPIPNIPAGKYTYGNDAIPVTITSPTSNVSLSNDMQTLTIGNVDLPVKAGDAITFTRNDITLNITGSDPMVFTDTPGAVLTYTLAQDGVYNIKGKQYQLHAGATITLSSNWNNLGISDRNPKTNSMLRLAQIPVSPGDEVVVAQGIKIHLDDVVVGQVLGGTDTGSNAVLSPALPLGIYIGPDGTEYNLNGNITVNHDQSKLTIGSVVIDVVAGMDFTLARKPITVTGSGGFSGQVSMNNPLDIPDGMYVLNGQNTQLTGKQLVMNQDGSLQIMPAVRINNQTFKLTGIAPGDSWNLPAATKVTLDGMEAGFFNGDTFALAPGKYNISGVQTNPVTVDANGISYAALALTGDNISITRLPVNVTIPDGANTIARDLNPGNTYTATPGIYYLNSGAVAYNIQNGFSLSNDGRKLNIFNSNGSTITAIDVKPGDELNFTRQPMTLTIGSNTIDLKTGAIFAPAMSGQYNLSIGSGTTATTRNITLTGAISFDPATSTLTLGTSADPIQLAPGTSMTLMPKAITLQIGGGNNLNIVVGETPAKTLPAGTYTIVGADGNSTKYTLAAASTVTLTDNARGNSQTLTFTPPLSGTSQLSAMTVHPGDTIRMTEGIDVVGDFKQTLGPGASISITQPGVYNMTIGSASYSITAQSPATTITMNADVNGIAITNGAVLSVPTSATATPQNVTGIIAVGATDSISLTKAPVTFNIPGTITNSTGTVVTFPSTPATPTYFAFKGIEYPIPAGATLQLNADATSATFYQGNNAIAITPSGGGNALSIDGLTPGSKITMTKASEVFIDGVSTGAISGSGTQTLTLPAGSYTIATQPVSNPAAPLTLTLSSDSKTLTLPSSTTSTTVTLGVGDPINIQRAAVVVSGAGPALIDPNSGTNTTELQTGFYKIPGYAEEVAGGTTLTVSKDQSKVTISQPTAIPPIADAILAVKPGQTLAVEQATQVAINDAKEIRLYSTDEKTTTLQNGTYTVGTTSFTTTDGVNDSMSVIKKTDQTKVLQISSSQPSLDTTQQTISIPLTAPVVNIIQGKATINIAGTTITIPNGSSQSAPVSESYVVRDRKEYHLLPGTTVALDSKAQNLVFSSGSPSVISLTVPITLSENPPIELPSSKHITIERPGETGYVSSVTQSYPLPLGNYSVKKSDGTFVNFSVTASSPALQYKFDAKPPTITIPTTPQTDVPVSVGSPFKVLSQPTITNSFGLSADNLSTIVTTPGFYTVGNTTFYASSGTKLSVGRDAITGTWTNLTITYPSAIKTANNLSIATNSNLAILGGPTSIPIPSTSPSIAPSTDESKTRALVTAAEINAIDKDAALVRAQKNSNDIKNLKTATQAQKDSAIQTLNAATLNALQAHHDADEMFSIYKKNYTGGLFDAISAVKQSTPSISEDILRTRFLAMMSQPASIIVSVYSNAKSNPAVQKAIVETLNATIRSETSHLGHAKLYQFFDALNPVGTTAAELQKRVVNLFETVAALNKSTDFAAAVSNLMTTSINPPGGDPPLKTFISLASQMAAASPPTATTLQNFSALIGFTKGIKDKSTAADGWLQANNFIASFPTDPNLRQGVLYTLSRIGDNDPSKAVPTPSKDTDAKISAFCEGFVKTKPSTPLSATASSRQALLNFLGAMGTTGAPTPKLLSDRINSFYGSDSAAKWAKFGTGLIKMGYASATQWAIDTIAGTAPNQWKKKIWDPVLAKA